MMRDATHPPRTTADDRGIAAIWVAVMFSVLMGFAALTIDLGLWFIERSEVQNAADAAALAGATLLPDEPDAAVAEAERVAGQYGYTTAQVETLVTSGNQLEVKITSSVDNIFLPSIGFDDATNISGTAVAEYEGAVAMGSPENLLGNDPTDSGTQPDFTLGIAGPDQNKRNGDRFSTNKCGSGSVDQCDTSDGPNLEFDTNGYAYTVTVNDTSNGEDLVIEVYDPAWTSNNDTSCGAQTSRKGMPSDSELDDLVDLTDDSDFVDGSNEVPQGWFDDAHERYRAGSTMSDGSPNYWCTGDNQDGGNEAMVTSYIFREPDDTPWNPWNNPVIDEDDPTGRCEPVALEPTDFHNGPNTSYDILYPGENGEDEWAVDLTDGDWTFSELFHRWVPLCRIPAADLVEGDYIIQVRTSANASDPLTYDPTHTPKGQNFFMIRTGFDSGSGLETYGGDVSLAAQGRMPVNANLPLAEQTFFLAQVFPTSRERTLVVEMFDVGDASVEGTITIQPPSESSLGSFSGCTFTRGDGATLTYNASQCELQEVKASNGYNGRTVIAYVPIPDESTYDCNPSGGCWITLYADFAGPLTDFTTWSAYITGDPVRLIE